MGDSHSILLKESKCVGCTHCVKSCPTKAIRVHNGKAKIKDQYCIDCGACIESCNYHAKYAKSGSLDGLREYKYKVAITPISFYGQFAHDTVPEKITIALKNLGFDQIRTVAEGINILKQQEKLYLQKQDQPVISSACLSVVRLIKLLYPELLDYLAPFKTAEEILAQKIKQEVMAERDLKDDQIGIFLIADCSAKLTAVNNPLAIKESNFAGAIAVNNIYRKLLSEVRELKDLDDFTALADQERPYIYQTKESEIEDAINVAGIKNVVSVLEELSRDELINVKYFDLSACQPSSFGGVLNVKNPFLVQYNFNNLFKERYKAINFSYNKEDITLDRSFKENVVNPLDNDIMSAMKKLNQMDQVIDSLPKLDCAACGAPDCQSLAEDIVNNLASRTDCIFILRQEVADLADEMAKLANEMPPIMKSNPKGSD